MISITLTAARPWHAANGGLMVAPMSAGLASAAHGRPFASPAAVAELPRVTGFDVRECLVGALGVKLMRHSTIHLRLAGGGVSFHKKAV